MTFAELRSLFARLAQRKRGTAAVCRIEVYQSTADDKRARAVASEEMPPNDPEARSTAIDLLTEDVLRDLATTFGDIPYLLEVYADGIDDPIDSRQLKLTGGMQLSGVPTAAAVPGDPRTYDHTNAQFFANLFAKSMGGTAIRLEREAERAWGECQKKQARIDALEAQVEQLRAKKDERELAEKMIDNENARNVKLLDKVSSALHALLLGVAGGGQHSDLAMVVGLREFVAGLTKDELFNVLKGLPEEKALLVMSLVKAHFDKQDNDTIKELAAKAVGAPNGAALVKKGN